MGKLKTKGKRPLNAPTCEITINIPTYDKKKKIINWCNRCPKPSPIFWSEMPWHDANEGGQVGGKGRTKLSSTLGLVTPNFLIRWLLWLKCGSRVGGGRGRGGGCYYLLLDVECACVCVCMCQGRAPPIHRYIMAGRLINAPTTLACVIYEHFVLQCCSTLVLECCSVSFGFYIV